MADMQLEADGDGFTITDKNGIKLALSDQDVLTLAQSAQRLQDHILAKHKRSGVEAVSVVEVKQVVLNNDLHQTQIHLIFVDKAEGKTGFALPLEVAQQLATRLPERVNLLIDASKIQTKQ